MHRRSSGRERSQWGAGDPLSSVLLDLRLSGTFFCHSEFGSPWALEIAERDFASFHFVASGECWLQPLPAGRRAEAVRLGPGDLVLLPRSPHQVFSSSKRRTGTALSVLPARELSAAVSVLRRGGEPVRWLVVCGGLRFEAGVAASLVGLLPEVVVLRATEASPIVASALSAMRQEATLARPGSATVMARLADVVVIHAIRAWLEKSRPQIGWLAALRDPQIGGALAAVHQRPEGAWSVSALARSAKLSRSRFSERFTALVGAAPMQYLAKLRMQRALELLRAEPLSVGELAARFGYDSEAAFARAFKRHTGVSPGSVRGVRLNGRRTRRAGATRRS